jgi:hypothetical protein
MALSGSITQPFQTWWQLVLEWSATQSIANNTSTITANLYLESLGGYIISGSVNKTAHITIDGTTYTKTDCNINLSVGQKKLLFTANRTISHNPDGTKTFTLKGDCQINATLGGVYVGTVYLPQKSFTLNTIPRASSISSFPNFTIGENFTVTISRASSSFTHDLTLKVGTATIKTVTGVATSYTFSLSQAEQDIIYAATPNSTKATVTLFCQTKSGSSNVGPPVSKNATATVPASVVPTFDAIIHSEYVQDVAQKIGKYVQSLSRLNLEITGAQGAKFSTIKSYQIDFDGVSYNARTATSAAIKGSGNLTVTGKVTDSRGRTATKTVTVNVLPYAPPQITEFSLQRCNEDGTPNLIGEYVRVERVGSVSSLLNVTEKNSLTYRIKCKERGGSDIWATVKEETISGVSLTGADVISDFPITKSYDFILEISDQFNTTFTLGVLSTGTVPLSLSPHGIGVGKVWQRGVLDVLGEIFCNDGEMDGLVPVVESGSNSNGSYIKWSNGLQICWIPSITLTYVHTGLLRARWDYPAEFKFGSTPAGFANPIDYAPVASARTSGTVVDCAASFCFVSASNSSGTFEESNTWNFQAVAIGWWK